MAIKGSKKARSVEQENLVAKRYGGMRSASSGAAETDAGDVRTFEFLIECKMMGGPEERIKRPGFAKDFEKITQEAWMEGRIPMMAIRWYDPDSILANRDGWVDMIVKRMVDDGG